MSPRGACLPGTPLATKKLARPALLRGHNAKMAGMTRSVGTQFRSEFILDPAEAWHRGRLLDQMLAAASLPRHRGVQKAPHQVFNKIDDLRQSDQARVLNSPLGSSPSTKS